MGDVDVVVLIEEKVLHSAFVTGLVLHVTCYMLQLATQENTHTSITQKSTPNNQQHNNGNATQPWSQKTTRSIVVVTIGSSSSRTMLLLFTLIEFLAAAPAFVVAAAKLDDSPSNVVESLSSPPILPIKHERQRDAMLQALNSVGVDDQKFEAFTSPEEQRSQYYIHEGFKSAVHRAMRMANFDPETIWDPIVDVDSNNSDSSDNSDVEVEQWELVYSYFMEETLADMISDVEKSLQELTATNNNNEGAGDDEGQQTAPKTNGEASNSAQDKVKEEDFDAKELYYSVFDKIHNDYNCEAYNNITLDDPRGMWKNITKLYWTFFDIDIEDGAVTTLINGRSLYDYKTEGNVYFDFIIDEKRNVQAPAQPKQSTVQRGVFAARDFEQDELVYSYMANSLFFHELSTFERFIRFVSTSLSEYDACLLADWSFAQKLTRPGRFYICSALDDGVYLNQGSKYKANVYMDDTRDLRYYAKGKIVKGEEIICLD